MLNSQHRRRAAAGGVGTGATNSSSPYRWSSHDVSGGGLRETDITRTQLRPGYHKPYHPCFVEARSRRCVNSRTHGERTRRVGVCSLSLRDKNRPENEASNRVNLSRRRTSGPCRGVTQRTQASRGRDVLSLFQIETSPSSCMLHAEVSVPKQGVCVQYQL